MFLGYGLSNDGIVERGVAAVALRIHRRSDRPALRGVFLDQSRWW